MDRQTNRADHGGHRFSLHELRDRAVGIRIGDDVDVAVRTLPHVAHAGTDPQPLLANHTLAVEFDAPNVLVAMNPAALRNELPRLESGGTLIVNVDAFEERNLTKAGYSDNPLTDGSLEGYTVFEVPMTSLTQGSVEHLGVKPRDAERSKNFFALGLVSWIYTRPLEPTLEWIGKRFGKNPTLAQANIRVLTVALETGANRYDFKRVGGGLLVQTGDNMNVTAEQLTQLCEQATHKPMMVQNRCFAVLGWDKEVREICQAHGIIYQGFSLLTANREVLADPEIQRIAQRLGARSTQIIFRFAMQIGMLPLTGTTSQQHMKEDLQAERLALSEEEIRRIETIVL